MTKIIGIAGTAKNTGKTTTTTAIMEKVYSHQLKLGLTSIGYDGEVMDNVTGLPKPRIRAEKGTIVAIAQSCLAAGSADIEVLATTDIRTPLGKIVIGEVKEPGLVVIAGANKSSEVRIVNKLLKEQGCDLVLVDGALNRIAPMVETQGLIVATGAARTTNLPKLAEETSCMSAILNLPPWPEKEKATLVSTSLLNEAMVKELLQRVTSETREIVVTGIIGEKSFQALLDLGKDILPGKALVLPDPIKVLVAGAPDLMFEVIARLADSGTPVYVQKPVKLLAITVNPFYPRYRYTSHDYEPAYVEKEELKQSIQQKCKVPVVDVVEEGIDRLWATLGLE
ncbi:MAG: uncharacterized protein JG781_692 [Peptococcaceae bacterium]|jgi:molybdopterin-guanine dinucleotide biosynthesis protein|nr:uncharacterized protein [Peptococcaceae bacterium]